VRLLVDECVGRPLVDELRQRFADVAYVAEIHPAASDTEVLAWAIRDGRVLITEDYDFGELVFHKHLKAEAVVIIAPGALGAELIKDAKSIAERLLSASTELLGRLTIVERRRLRQRPLMTTE
jgi:predicted nuclease of predicted toxin-antitoxin system